MLAQKPNDNDIFLYMIGRCTYFCEEERFYFEEPGDTSGKRAPCFGLELQGSQDGQTGEVMCIVNNIPTQKYLPQGPPCFPELLDRDQKVVPQVQFPQLWSLQLMNPLHRAHQIPRQRQHSQLGKLNMHDGFENTGLKSLS